MTTLPLPVPPRTDLDDLAAVANRVGPYAVIPSEMLAQLLAMAVDRRRQLPADDLAYSFDNDAIVETFAALIRAGCGWDSYDDVVRLRDSGLSDLADRCHLLLRAEDGEL